MIYITGDTHGRFDRIEYFCDDNHTTKENDVMIILGDASVNYFSDSRATRMKKYLSRMPITFMLIRGNHEARPNEAWPVIAKTGPVDGDFIVEEEYPSILYMQDGGVYTLHTDSGDKKAFVIGGAYSVDKQHRLEMYQAGNHDYKWFADEQLSKEEMEEVSKKLDAAMDISRIDYLFTHTCPMGVEPRDVFLSYVDQTTVDTSTEDFLENMKQKIMAKQGGYDRWFCGHWHINRLGPDNTEFLFNEYKCLR